MNLVLISDTHNKHRKLTNLPDGDMIIHAGDLSDRGELPQIYDFINWYASLPYKYKIFISGNHDFSFQDGSRKNKIREALKCHPDIIYLEDEAVTIEGIKIYGTPWQPRFYDWAFNLDRGYPIREKWEEIPEDTDILVVHGPPYGYGDLCDNGDRVGCHDLLKRVLVVKPKLCIFGHIHEGWGMYSCREDRDITMINCSVLDSQYFLTNDPVAIKYEDFI